MQEMLYLIFLTREIKLHEDNKQDKSLAHHQTGDIAKIYKRKKKVLTEILYAQTIIGFFFFFLRH